MNIEYRCSECGREISPAEYEEQDDVFCPECGGQLEQNEDKVWCYLGKNGKLTGPFHEEDLLQAYLNKTITPQTKIFHLLNQQWKPLSGWDALQPVYGSSPPVADESGKTAAEDSTANLMVPCEACSHLFSRRAKECPKCGWKRQAICQVCHQKIPLDSASCPECGDPAPFQALQTGTEHIPPPVAGTSVTELEPNPTRGTSPPQEPELPGNRIKKTPVWLVVFLSAVSGGLYTPIWFLTRREAINELKSDEKLGAGVFIFAVVGLSVALLAMMMGWFYEGIAESYSNPSFLSVAQQFDNIDRLISVVVGLTLLVQCFKVRRIFYDHYNIRHGRTIELSGVLIFFFHIIYLQYHINRFDDIQEDPYTTNNYRKTY